MELPVRSPVQKPAVLDGQSNGLLPTSILWSTPGLAGGSAVRLVAPAARAWRALTAAALAADHTLKATSAADSYRTYAQQVSTFGARYQLEPTNNGYRLWDSDGNGVSERWYRKDGVAPAAVPGTSNHGWGLAVDVGEERDGDTGTESMDAATLTWLAGHEVAFGFSHELQVEPWHIRYFAGDAIPAAVLAYEESLMDWRDLLPDPTKRQAGPGAAGDLLWIVTWHAYDAKAAALQALAVANDTAAKLDQILTLLQATTPGTVNLTPEALEDISDKVAEVVGDTKISVTLDTGV